MKKKGRGSAYDKALMENLVRSLILHKKITTTASRAQLLKKEMLRRESGNIKLLPMSKRLGDNAQTIQVEWQEAKKDNEDKTDKTKSDSKTMASH